MAKAARRSGQVFSLCIALMLFWIACVASLHKDELILGVPAVLLSAGFSFFAISKVPIRFRPSLANLLDGWRLPWYVIQDLALVLWVLAKDLLGQRAPSLFRSAPWRANSKSARDLARRALAVAYSTVSPNCIVIGIDRERGQMLFHQLHRSPLPAMTQRLGAGAEK